MNIRFTSRLLSLTFLSMLSIGTIQVSAQSKSSAAKSNWVYANAQGKLVYKTLPAGDKIMDFSHAGYMGGGVRLPDVAVKVTISPVAGDNSAQIQQAIDKVAQMPLVNGFRGAVLLRPGTYDCEQTLNIKESGVVLSGSGSGADGSVINMTGKPHLCISVKGRVTTKPIGALTNITDKYVPSGTYTFSVADATSFVVNDTIQITRLVTESWVHFMGMDHLVRDGKAQTWINGVITTERVIKNIEGNKITVTVPLTDNYDSKFLNPPGVTVTKIMTTGELSQIGIEDLRIVSPDQSVTINEGSHHALTMSGLSDGWVRSLQIVNTVNSVSITGKRITLTDVHITHTLPTIGAAKPADLNGSGPQILFDRCSITGDNLFFLATGAKVTGPIVLLNCVFHGNGWIQPHQRWATGLLIDNCEVPGGGIDFMNRGEMGSGHGWAIGWAVAWNCKAKSYLNQQPPGAANWVIGSAGQQQKRAMPFDTLPLLPEAIYDAHGTPVSPKSLYLAQLAERLGKTAVQNIGYEVTDIAATKPKDEILNTSIKPQKSSKQ